MEKLKKLKSDKPFTPFMFVDEIDTFESRPSWLVVGLFQLLQELPVSLDTVLAVMPECSVLEAALRVSNQCFWAYIGTLYEYSNKNTLNHAGGHSVPHSLNLGCTGHAWMTSYGCVASPLSSRTLARNILLETNASAKDHKLVWKSGEFWD